MNRRGVGTLAAWAGVLAAAALAWLAAGSLLPAAAVEEPPPEQASTRGDTLYTTHCARCHAADGSGGADELSPALVGMEVARVDLALRTRRMPPAREDGTGRGEVVWGEADREVLVAHLTAVFDLQGPLLDPEPGNPAAGREVFATHCAACHGYTASGGVAGAGAITPPLVGLEPAVVAAAIRVGPFQMPQFGLEQISDDELGHVAAYLEEIAHEESTLLGLVELHPVHLAAFVALLAAAMILSCLFLAGRVAMFPDPDTDSDPHPDPDADADSEPAPAKDAPAAPEGDDP